MPKQHPVGFGWQPKASTKLTDSIPRKLEITLVKTFVGTMDEAMYMIAEDENYIMGETENFYDLTESKIDGWTTTLIDRELNKYGH